MASDPLAPSELFGHAQDATYFHFPRGWFGADETGHLALPQPLAKEREGVAHPHIDNDYQPIAETNTGVAVIDNSLRLPNFVLTKFMVIELAVAIICVVLFGWLATTLKGGRAPKGRLANLLEVFLIYIRDEVVYAAIGRKDGDRFLPFLWTMFFFILGCNLFGMVPWMGSPTGALAMTGMMALVTFGAVVAAGMAELGPVGFLKAQAPHMDVPKPMAVFLVPMIWVIEVFGLLLKHLVLAIRLLANMLAGHLILAVVVGFIGAAAAQMAAIAWGVTFASVLAAVALSCMELFVAFLQAYIFTFLSALFIGAAVHPH
ncbi:ATP synthase subunit a [Pseudobythopirellula maris]|uniref:ATP synthase subunit a n=1 Tax=Pseudobythopirellula maris TaxID=2527991 RepID=A0A5C5ZT29_9BACT|nr:F0F1 ATP synthase subunit A [Pseudobythopirellula maris]TWT89941.1 ATP synthase subunit a [Pseudobythopirellula maris]